MEAVKPEMVVEILSKRDVHISLEQAKIILAFMVKLAEISLNQNAPS